MSRPIKFRAWDCTRIIDLKVLSLEKPLPFPLMQFTGLHDKNGKEIWEGDVCRIHDLVKGSWKPVNRAVHWDETVAGFFPNFGGDEIEVIGNIYENPELLNDHSQ